MAAMLGFLFWSFFSQLPLCFFQSLLSNFLQHTIELGCPTLPCAVLSTTSPFSTIFIFFVIKLLPIASSFQIGSSAKVLLLHHSCVALSGHLVRVWHPPHLIFFPKLSSFIFHCSDILFFYSSKKTFPQALRGIGVFQLPWVVPCTASTFPSTSTVWLSLVKGNVSSNCILSGNRGIHLGRIAWPWMS